MSRILVADDERGICEAFVAFLSSEGHEALVASNGTDAVRLVQEKEPAVVFLDAQMPGTDGLTALEKIKEFAPAIPVIVMTAFGTLETARRAIDLGAFDYLGKPVELENVRDLLRRALHKPQTSSATLADTTTSDGTMLLGQSAVMQQLFKRMALLAGNELTILITGESGVGKELVAKAIHESGSNADQPFVAVNCAAIPDTLIEAELFGSEAGAFTDAKSRRIGRFEAAGTGTLFLDEVSEIPYHLQSKLLRAIQERSFERLGSVKTAPFQARLVAASNRNMEEAVAAGQFREDLYHRLNLASLPVPPLREREQDIELLAAYFLRQANDEIGKSITGIEPDVIARLKKHAWPGNVRELEHSIKRAVLGARGTTVTVDDLSLSEPDAHGREDQGGMRDWLQMQTTKMVTEPENFGGSGQLYQHLIDIATLELIRSALKISDGNQVAAAQLLGINRSTLRKKLAAHRD